MIGHLLQIHLGCKPNCRRKMCNLMLNRLFLRLSLLWQLWRYWKYCQRLLYHLWKSLVLAPNCIYFYNRVIHRVVKFISCITYTANIEFSTKQISVTFMLYILCIKLYWRIKYFHFSPFKVISFGTLLLDIKFILHTGHSVYF